MLPLRGCRRVCFLFLLVAVSILPSPVHAQPPACPDLAVVLSARPTTAKPGGPLGVRVKVRNAGTTPLQDVGLRLTVPLGGISYHKATAHPRIAGDDGSYNPFFQAPQVYWPRFSLQAGKARTFTLKARVSKCQAAGTFVLEAAAYLAPLNCSTLKTVQVRVAEVRMDGKGSEEL
jgi:hypothetical protein